MDVTVSLSSLVAASRATGGRLPFPFADPEGSDGFPDDPDLEAADALSAAVASLNFARLTVYAVVADGIGAVATQATAGEDGDGHCFAVTVTGSSARVCSVGRQDLVRSVVDAVGTAHGFASEALFDRDLAVPLQVVKSDDKDAVADGLRANRVSSHDVDAWLSTGRLIGSGLLGAIATDDTGQMQHVTRSVSWRRYANGSVLVVEQPRRSRREPEVILQALSARTLTRAALQLLTSLNAQAVGRAGALVGASSNEGGNPT